MRAYVNSKHPLKVDIYKHWNPCLHGCKLCVCVCVCVCVATIALPVIPVRAIILVGVQSSRFGSELTFNFRLLHFFTHMYILIKHRYGEYENLVNSNRSEPA